MKLIKEYPIKNKNWGYISHEDGEYHTGYTSSYYDYNKDGWTTHVGLNIVLKGGIKVLEVSRGRSAAGCNVEDTDNEDHQFYISVGNMVKVLQYISDGKLAIENGNITGLWTLTKQGTTVSLTPYNE